MKISSLLLVLVLVLETARAQDPLPSWNDTAPKKAIVDFVEKVTKGGSPDFVPVSERIATFDNDGTLSGLSSRCNSSSSSLWIA